MLSFKGLDFGVKVFMVSAMSLWKVFIVSKYGYHALSFALEILSLINPLIINYGSGSLNL